MKLSMLVEARVPGVSYTVKETKKGIERVTAKLEGSSSATLSRMAKRYVRLESSLEAMQKARDAMNERLKDEVSNLFEPEEAVLTRVVETVSFSLTMAKEIEKEVPESVKRDYEKIAAELTKLIPEELQSKIEEITALYSTITPASTKPGIKKLSVSALDEGLLTTVKKVVAAVTKALRQFRTWATSYDNKIDDLKNRLQEVKAKARKR